MPVGSTGDRIDVFVFGDLPKCLADRARGDKDIAIHHRAEFTSDQFEHGSRFSGGFVWIDTDVAADLRLRLFAAGARDVWSPSDCNVSAVIQANLDRFRQRQGLCAELAGALGLVGDSPATRLLREHLAEACLLGDVPVLLLGATGTGKMHAAKALHAIDQSRAGQPMATLDCGAATDEIFASDFFGHLRGAFTGADKSRDGAIVTAAEGYLVLDEIGELSPRLQSALLCVLQERQFKPVGSDRSYPVRCRIVSLTNRPLAELVETGGFRRDLFHRLDGITIQVPALGERVEDIPAIFHSIVCRCAGHEVEIESAVGTLLREQAFPGNVRQLEMAARIAVARRVDPTRIRLGDLPGWLRRRHASAGVADAPSLIQRMLADQAGLEEIATACCIEAVELKLEQLRASFPRERRTALVKRAAEHLKVSERTVYNRLNGHAPPVA